VHAAAESAGAAAFTVGNDIGLAVGPGQAIPAALLRHELIHVAQQQGGTSLGQPGAAAEAEQEAATAALDSLAPIALVRPGGPYVACAPEDWLQLRSFDFERFAPVDLENALNEINEWLGWQIRSTPQSERLLEVRAQIEAAMSRKHQKVLQQDRVAWRRAGPGELSTIPSPARLRLLRQRIDVRPDSTLNTSHPVALKQAGALPELSGITTQSYYNLREKPGTSAKLIGRLTGEEAFVRVDAKAKADGIVWYRITLNSFTGQTEDGHALPMGTTAWVTADGVTPVIGWEEFIAQLHAWEKAHGESDMSASITVLRRMSHRSNLPFDQVIGRQESGIYLDTQPFDPSDWKLLNDAQQVRTPDGRIVDMQHLFVGLDVLTNMKEDHTISGMLYTLRVGQNYSAATWAGDIGAGAADAAEEFDSEWEKQHPNASREDRINRYYFTRAPAADLLGDIDAWGMDAERSEPNVPRTVTELLSKYYGAPSVQSEYGPSFPFNTSKRKTAVERFIRHYGFKLGGGPLVAQTEPREAMAKQVKIFGRAWLFFRNAPFRSEHEDDMHAYADDMTAIFLEWLDWLALEVGAGT